MIGIRKRCDNSLLFRKTGDTFEQTKESIVRMYRQFLRAKRRMSHLLNNSKKNRVERVRF